MAFPKWATTVTPASKILALVVFTVLPILAFIFGLRYQSLLTPYQLVYVPQLVVRDTGDTDMSLISRCGKYEDRQVVKPAPSQTAVGPRWAPDCRHIAWSIAESGPGEATLAVSKNEGIYVLSDSTGNVQKVYAPIIANESPEFIRWMNGENLLFRAGTDEFIFDLKSETFSMPQMETKE